MWAYLEHLATLLESVGKVMRAIPDTEFRFVREGLSTSSRRYSASQRKSRVGILTRTQSVPFVTGADGHLLPGERNL